MNDSIHEESGSLRQAKIRLDRLSKTFPRLLRPQDTHPFRIQQFIENLRIINKQGEMVSLIMNRSQELVFHKLMECREKRIPARFICCKARQLGISTLIEAFIFALITHYPNRFALIVAHSIESAQTIFSITHRFYRHLAGPEGRELPLARINSRVIEYPSPHYSRMQIDTAANRNLGRGGTLHYVHASEVGFWDRPEEPILAINQSVPRHWDTVVFWESTANGIRNLFHRTWIAAERGESEMEPIFLPWKGFPEYSLPVAPRERLSLTAKEERFARQYRLSSGEIKWARYTRINQCHNSWEKFHQEYPAAASLAFTFSGMPWFSQEVVQELLENLVCEPLKRGYLEFSSDTARSAGWRPRLVDHEEGVLQVWKLPQSGLSYSLGMDVGEGVGADYTVIQVLCNETGEVVASYRSNRVRAEMAGVDAYLLGSWYNFGLLGIERNGPGLATLAVCERGMAEYPQITGYPNLYYHTYTDRKIPEETRRLGWITNKSTKEAMLSRLARTIENRDLKIFSKTAVLEIQGFVWDPEKKNFKQNYTSPDSKLAHDDEIIALAIANEMRIHNWESRFIPRTLPEGGDF
ncbi:MAG: hypothetical protein P8182_12390 [Deltaproteobacteria bacterium]